MSRTLHIVIAAYFSCYVYGQQIEDMLSENSTNNLNFFINKFELNNSICAIDIQYMLDSVSKQEIWGMKMLDSASKTQSGLALGNIVNLGSFDECMSISEIKNNDHQFSGKYCLYGLFISVFGALNTSGLPIPGIALKYLEQHKGIPLLEAVCIPDSCSVQDIYDILNSTSIQENLPFSDLVFEERACQTNTNIDTSSFSLLQWFAILLIVGAAFLMIISTAYDLYCLKFKKKPHELIITFSIYSNMRKLTTVKRDPDQLPCINGIRFLSIMWVMIGHRFLLTAVYPNTNYLYLLTWLNEYSSFLITGATVSVDTFFLISGTLVMYVMLLADDKGFNINLLRYYIHRVLRLSPALFMVVIIYMTLFRYMGHGPLWPIAYQIFEDPCVRNWWKTLLFLQDFQSYGEICVTQTWYLSIDTQLYVLAPLLFVPIKRWPAPTICIIVLLTAASCMIGFIRSWNNYINATILMIGPTFNTLYNSILVRMNTWLIGSVLGYILFITRGAKIKINKFVVFGLWTIAVSVMLMIAMSQVYFTRNEYDRLISALYIGFARAAWALSLSWIIFACVHGFGGVVNKFLSMNIFIVLGRLTYAMYLLHIAVLVIILGSSHITERFSNVNNYIRFWGDLVIVILVSLIWSLAFESPIIAIGKILLPEDIATRLAQLSNDTNENSSTTTGNSNHVNTYL